MDKHTRAMGYWGVAILSALVIGCGNGDEPLVRGGEDSVCPTCLTTAGGETADFGDGMHGELACERRPAPLSDEVADAYGLAALEELLGRPQTVEARWGEHDGRSAVGAGQSGETVPVTFEFDLGEFQFERATEAYQDENCDAVRAPLRVRIEVGDGLLMVDAIGELWKPEDDLQGLVYARADLTKATGKYRLEIDDERPHVAAIEMSLSVFPEQIRGEVTPFVMFFDDESKAAAYLKGDWSAFGDFRPETSLSMPLDDCDQQAFPLESDAPSTLLSGRTPMEIVAAAVEDLADTLEQPGVWRDDTETLVTIEPEHANVDYVCVESDYVQLGTRSGFEGPTLMLYTPHAGRLRTEDGEIDMPLTGLRVTLARTDGEVLDVRLDGVLETENLEPGAARNRKWEGDRLDALVEFKLDSDPPTADGIVYVEQTVEDGEAWDWTDCVAFPAGGKWDTEECRYMRPAR